MKFKTYILFFLLFGVLADTLLGLTLLRPVSLGWKLVMALPTLVAGLCLPFIGTGRFYANALRVFSYVIFLFELPKFLVALNGLFLPVGVAVGIGAAVSLFFFTLIFYVTRHLQVRETSLGFERLPEKASGLRICHIADFHLGSFGPASPYIQRIVETVNAQKPDVILFTGDLVNFEAREAFPYREVLGRLQAPLGVYSVLGNHDFLLHGPHDSHEEARLQDMAALEAFERELDWKVLRNQNVVLDNGVALVGVDNVSTNPYFRKVGGDLKQAMEGLDPAQFTILLSHDPTHWRREVLPETTIDLTLSGHTHGLRYKLTGLHPSHWRLHESCGLYQEGKRMLYVTFGLGSAFAFRLGGYPYIEMITLTKT